MHLKVDLFIECILKTLRDVCRNINGLGEDGNRDTFLIMDPAKILYPVWLNITQYFAVNVVWIMVGVTDFAIFERGNGVSSLISAIGLPHKRTSWNQASKWTVGPRVLKPDFVDMIQTLIVSVEKEGGD